MLASLSIRNFVLIEDATLEFDPGLTVLTGETGAGKTLLTRALGLLLGERAEDGLVGTAGDEAVIEAVFVVNESDLEGVPDQVRDLVGAQPVSETSSDAPPNDFAERRARDTTNRESLELIVTRRLSREGRNRCYLNGSAVTLAVMSETLGRLVSFAGQHEHRRLLDPVYQLQVLDQWAGRETLSLAERYRRAFRRAEAAARVLEEAQRSQESRLREMRLLRYEVEELEAAALSEAEECSLAAEQRLLAGAEELLREIGTASELLSTESDEPDAAGLLAQAAAQLAKAAAIDEALYGPSRELQDMQYRLAEVTRELHSYMAGVSVNPERLQTVESRLRLYNDLARKYGGSTAAAVDRLHQAQTRLWDLERVEDDLQGMGEARAAQCALALDLASQLSQRRQEAVPPLEEAVQRQLVDLGMASAAFKIALHHRPGWEGLRESGAEGVEFLLAANPGQPYRSLAATASGGELSRVLLALKCALAGAAGNESLVFDEIDAGIGGRTAVAVAQKLREMSCRSQAIVVTHLAPVAARADRHYLISKENTAVESTTPSHSDPLAGTITRLLPLHGDAVVEEVCRMMGGSPRDTEAMAHARELRDRAQGGC